MAYIYIVTNLINKKQYVGKAINFKKRINHHIYEAKNNKGYYFQRAIKKYGIENFKFIKFDWLKEETAQIEIMWIRILNSKRPNGYNLTDGGEGTKDSSGLIAKKISNSLRNQPKTEQHKKNISIAKIGQKVSEKTKQKISEANKGRTCSEETKTKISKANKGKTRNIEFIQKMKRPKTEEHRENLSNSLTKYFESHDNPMKGKEPWHKNKIGVYSKETLKKMSEARKKYWQKRKQDKWL